ncbi:hypothetical protein MNBD_ALPHA06-1251 [hydrothermal vent metagenome]|uniref:Nitroreductase domain-containing protein n=1 Tax=hydrothermal vent metagenome TaxID=652676 RepID=A0A3B0S6A1_9ZZZZ
MPTVLLPPNANQSLAASTYAPEVLAFLNTRRSTPLPLLTAPGPDAEQLATILRLAARVPDHRRVVPFRFVVFEGTAKEQAAARIMQQYRHLHPTASQSEIVAEGRKFGCSPLVIALVSTPDQNHKTPVWEQQLTVGAAGQNLLLAANASGFAAVWLTYWYATDAQICQDFGLVDGESIAGFFHLGSARETLQERPRPKMDKITSHWVPDTLQQKQQPNS